MSARSPFYLVVFASFASMVGAHADVRVVAPTGAPFAQIQAAIDASADGDVILVKAGTYTGFTITDKQLDVVADTGATVTVTSQARIDSLDATRRVTLSGVRVSNGGTGSALRLQSNSGSVRVQDCQMSAGTASGSCATATFGGSGAEINASADVSFVRCTLNGNYGTSGCYEGTWGGSGVIATSSRIALFDCSSNGSGGGTYCALWCTGCGIGYGYGGTGGYGGSLFSNSEAFASGSSFHGGPGGGNCHATDPGGYGGAGFGLFSVSMARTVGCTFAGGFGTGSMTQNGAPISGNGLVQLASTVHHLSVTSPVREAGTITLTVTGQPGEEVELLLADRTTYLARRTWTGVALVKPEHPAPVLQLGRIGPSGSMTVAWTAPNLDPAAQHERLFLQASFKNAVGATAIGPPATIVLLDSAF